MKTRCAPFILLGISLILAVGTASAALYNGNGNTDFGGAVGSGSLSLSDDGTTISGTFTRGSSSFDNNLVIFIDSQSGGFTSTSTFNDANDALRRSISGIDGGGNRSTANFTAPGFAADYAIAFGVSGPSFGNPNFGGLWSLASGNNNSLNFISSVNINPNNNTSATSYTFNFNWSDIGLSANQAGNSLKFISTYISGSGYRSGESFEHIVPGSSAGWNTFTFDTADTFLTAVPEPANVGLAVFGGILGVIGLARHGRRWLGKLSVG